MTDDEQRQAAKEAVHTAARAFNAAIRDAEALRLVVMVNVGEISTLGARFPSPCIEADVLLYMPPGEALP